MLKYSRIAKDPKMFKSVTGVSIKQFDLLYSKIEKQYSTAESKRLAKRKRYRKIGAGRKFNLELKDRVLMTLMYYRMYTSHDILGLLFGLDNSNVYRNITYMKPMIESHIPIPAKKYPKSAKAITIPELLANFPEFKVIVTALKKSIFGAKNPDKQRIAHYNKRA